MPTCPQCQGNKKVLEFRPGNREPRSRPGATGVTGEAAGWKAVECTECQGTGEVTEERAAAIEKKVAAEAEAIQRHVEQHGRRRKR